VAYPIAQKKKKKNFLFSLSDPFIYLKKDIISCVFFSATHTKSIFFYKKKWHSLNLKIYQQLSASLINLTLPITIAYEKTSTFLNIEGKLLRSFFVEVPIGNIRLDWSFLLSQIYFLTLFSAKILIKKKLNQMWSSLGTYFDSFFFFILNPFFCNFLTITTGFLVVPFDLTLFDLISTKSKNMLLSFQRTLVFSSSF